MKKISRFIEIACRYYISILMFVYGLVKVCGSQFSVETFLQDVPLGKLNGTQLTWAFYDFHPAYQVIIGVTEVVIGALVLFPRTSRLGLVLFMPVSFNIMILNLMYGIAALPVSVSLFIAGCILLIFYFRSYAAYFFRSQKTRVVTGKFRQIAGPVLAVIIGCLLASFVIYHNEHAVQNDQRLRGKWDVVNNENVRSVYFEKGDQLVMRSRNDSMFYGRYRSNNGRLTINSKNVVIAKGEYAYKWTNDSLLILDAGQHIYTLMRR